MALLSTTRDTLYQGRLTVEQPKDGYRFGTDAMLLAASVAADAGDTVLEMGCGVGAALMVAACRLPDVFFTGIERDPVYAELARKNVTENELSERVSVIEGDALNKKIFSAVTLFNHVIANPPYFQHQPQHDMHDLRRAAREEEEDGVKNWLQAANRFLHGNGTVTFIHAADRMQDIIEAMQHFCGDITVFPLFPDAVKAAKRVIIRGTKGSRAPLRILPGLILHDGSGGYYTTRADKIINYGESLWSD